MSSRSSSNIREKFGLDYLTTGSSNAVPSPKNANAPDADAERTLVAFGYPILSKLDGMEAKQSRLYELVDQTGLKLETLLKMTDQLNALGLVRVVENDKYGNHQLQLTQVGEDLIRKG